MTKNLATFISKILLSSLLLGLFSCTREKDSAHEIFERYEGTSGVVSFQVPPGLLSLFMSPEVGKELDLLLKDVTKIKVLSIDQKAFQKTQGQAFREVFGESLRNNHFAEALFFSQDTDVMWVQFLQDKKKVREIVISLENKDLFFAVSMEGKIPIEKFVRFSQQVDPFQLIKELKGNSKH